MNIAARLARLERRFRPDESFLTFFLPEADPAEGVEPAPPLTEPVVRGDIVVTPRGWSEDRVHDWLSENGTPVRGAVIVGIDPDRV